MVFAIQKILFLGALFLLQGCAPSSLSDFHSEGEERACRLTAVLRGIQNTEDLMRKEGVLKKHFNSLVDLMIEVRTFQYEKLEGVSVEPALSSGEASALLERELRRIYALEGGREVIERAQKEALVRLDTFEHRLAKKKARRR